MNKKMYDFEIFMMLIMITIITVLTIHSGYAIYKYFTQSQPQQYIVVWENSITGKSILMKPSSEKSADGFVEIGNKWNPGIVRAWKFPYHPDKDFQHGSDKAMRVWQKGVLVDVPKNEIPSYIP